MTSNISLWGILSFKDISTFYDGRVIGVNVDNEENRKKKTWARFTD